MWEAANILTFFCKILIPKYQAGTQIFAQLLTQWFKWHFIFILNYGINMHFFTPATFFEEKFVEKRRKIFFRHIICTVHKSDFFICFQDPLPWCGTRGEDRGKLSLHSDT
jgi:hypothetical protein